MTKRKPVIAGNWKMHNLKEESVNLVKFYIILKNAQKRKPVSV